jgi:hypothetical protein
MVMPPTSSPRHPAFRVLRLTAWVILAAAVLSFVAATASVQEWLREMDERPAFYAVHTVMPNGIALTMIVAWASALWYAVIDPRDHLLPKWFIVVLLILSNAIGAFFYYFLFVCWQEDPARTVQARVGEPGRRA